jgi:hypothetical protein
VEEDGAYVGLVGGSPSPLAGTKDLPQKRKSDPLLLEADDDGAVATEGEGAAAEQRGRGRPRLSSRWPHVLWGLGLGLLG